ncbi:MAG: 30S ribosomal protein S9 [Candidatus Colwellbacteria bacterium]|nr:30S ribosomal protein S9 [Candidatus Colwellbacteria bacterium]
MVKETTNKYLEAVGRRKTAVARVRLYPAVNKSVSIVVNGKPYDKYFTVQRYKENVLAPFKVLELGGKAEAKVSGGGISAQSEAVRLGLSRALVKFEADHKKNLRKEGFLTRDARKVERKKYGLSKARRAHQWRKR